MQCCCTPLFVNEKYSTKVYFLFAATGHCSVLFKALHSRKTVAFSTNVEGPVFDAWRH